MMFNINQTTANELIKVLKEFVNTGELKWENTNLKQKN
jgi:hypothetical protein